MTVEELRELIGGMEIDERRPIEVTALVERLENALNVVLDEFDHPISEDSDVVLMNRSRVMRDIAKVLGLDQRSS